MPEEDNCTFCFSIILACCTNLVFHFSSSRLFRVAELEVIFFFLLFHRMAIYFSRLKNQSQSLSFDTITMSNECNLYKLKR